MAKRSGVKTFEQLAERRRRRTFLLRLNDDELRKLDELAAANDVPRSSALRMALTRTHAEVVEAPVRERAETDVAREAARLAVNERITELKDELLAGVRSRKTKEKSP